MILTLTGCSVPYSDFSRDLLISNQEIVEETVETTDTTSTTDRETVVIATGEWAPFVGEEIPGNGFTTEIVIAAFSAVDKDVELQFVPWSRALELTESNDVFGTYPWTFTPEKKELYKIRSLSN